MANEAQQAAAVQVLDAGPEAAERGVLRARALQLLRECDSTTQMLELVLESHLELMREQLLADEVSRTSVEVASMRVPFSLTVEQAVMFGQTAPALLKEQIAEFKDEEESDLSGDAPASPTPIAERGLEQQAVELVRELGLKWHAYIVAWHQQEKDGTLLDANNRLQGLADKLSDEYSASKSRIEVVARQLFACHFAPGTPAATVTCEHGNVLKALRDVLVYAEVFVDAMLLVAPESEDALRGVDAILAAKNLTGEGPSTEPVAVAVARSA